MQVCTKGSSFPQFTEDELEPRNPENYDYQCSLLSAPLASADSVTYGIFHRSPLNEVDHFDVANGQLPQNIMHVLFEGVLQKKITLMFCKFVNDEKYFTLDTLNDRVKSFAYGRIEARNKLPKPLTPERLTKGRLPLSGE